MERFRVVVADDDADLRVVLIDALERTERFEIVAAVANAADAEAVARAEQPDLVLLDLDMPDGGGLDVVPRVHAAAPDARVVVVSGFPSSRFAGDVRDRGAVGFVQKGLSPGRLVDEVLAVAGVLDIVQATLPARHQALEASLASGATARRFMEETLHRWQCGEVLDLVNLLVTELVTNAVVHGGSEADVSVALTPTALRVDVADRDERMPQPITSVDAWDTSGRGLAFVATMSQRWGVQRVPGGKVIWFEVARPDR
jgi:DNA-binding NarL/FixJ family response regulator